MKQSFKQQQLALAGQEPQVNTRIKAKIDGFFQGEKDNINRVGGGRRNITIDNLNYGPDAAHFETERNQRMAKPTMTLTPEKSAAGRDFYTMTSEDEDDDYEPFTHMSPAESLENSPGGKFDRLAAPRGGVDLAGQFNRMRETVSTDILSCTSYNSYPIIIFSARCEQEFRDK